MLSYMHPFVCLFSPRALRSVALRVLMLLAALSLTGCSTELPQCVAPPLDGLVSAQAFRVLSYNIGNGQRAQPYALRVSDRSYERHLAGKIAETAPELVFLQEVLPPSQCEGVGETDKNRSCFAAESDAPQIRRILGDAYSIACDANQHVECIGVHRSFGTIRGLEPGGIDLEGASTAALPGRPCDYLRGECTGRSSRCDAESSISTVVIDTERGPVRAVHVHPTAIGKSCLQKQLLQAFELADDLPSILAGDWNFDPSSATDLAATSIWTRWVGDNARFVDHSPRNADCRHERTSVGQNTSLDRIVSDFAQGACHVWNGPRFDDGMDFSTLEGRRADHFAVDCLLDPTEL